MRRWALVAIVLLLAAACDLSHVDPEQTVIISGRALTAAGHPLADVEVHLYKEPDVGEVIIGSVLALGSLGAVCLLPAAPAICNQGHSTTTGADGSYRFTIKGSDTQGLVGDASTLDVVFTDPAGGAHAPSTTLRFKAQTKNVRLPAARLWNAGLHVAAHPSRRPTFAMSWSRLSGIDGSDAGYSVQLLDPTQGLALWSQPAAGNRAQIDARIIEDHAADAAVTARARLRGVEVIYLSSRTPAQAIAGAPPSRNKPCSAVTGTKRLATVKQTDCAATDGNLVAPAQLTPTKGGTVTGVVVDLGRVRRVGLVVARGIAGSVVVELSTDGGTYHRVARGDGATIAIDPPGQPPARYVRIRSASGLGESLLYEVSVW
jgi:hypothetical protein